MRDHHVATTLPARENFGGLREDDYFVDVSHYLTAITMVSSAKSKMPQKGRSSAAFRVLYICLRNYIVNSLRTA
jgi:hypothetical protein